MASPKLALLIGINYRGTSSELNGCINDVNDLKKILINRFKYKEENIKILTDDTEDKPTGENIVKELELIIEKAKTENASDLWVSYSGHGSYLWDNNGDEKDHKDEVLVPVDYQTGGMIRDDTIHDIFAEVPETCKVMCLIDSCHSGTVLDLKYKYVNNRLSIIDNANSNIKSNIIMISGCRDNQTSADSYNSGQNKWEGAMTASFLRTVNRFKRRLTIFKLVNRMRRYLKNNRFTQIPQLTSTTKLNKRTLFY